MGSIEERLNVDDKLMSDYYYEMASSIYWWADSEGKSFVDLPPIQQAKFSRLVKSITKKKGISKMSALWRFIDIVGNQPKIDS